MPEEKPKPDDKNSKTGDMLDFIKKGGLDELYKSGGELLGALTGCKIKPKGTPHREVWSKAPKFFHLYTNGKLPNEAGFKSYSGYFDITSGRDLPFSEIELDFGQQNRKKVEVTLRKKCETPTGVIDYYISLKNDFQGYVVLSDGKKYDGGMYGVKGGTYANPINLPNVKPLTKSLEDFKETITPPAQAGGGNFAVIAAIAYMLFKGAK